MSRLALGHIKTELFEDEKEMSKLSKLCEQVFELGDKQRSTHGITSYNVMPQALKLVAVAKIMEDVLNYLSTEQDGGVMVIVQQALDKVEKTLETK